MRKIRKRIFTSYNKQLIISIAIFSGLVLVTLAIILYGKGYRFGFEQNSLELKGTGLLVAKSIPDGAQVFIDGKLKTATDTTINMPPGEYEIKIVKDGYFPWQKMIKIETEVVTLADALLIPVAPKLESISDTGANNPVIDPTLTKIAFTVSSGSAEKNGIYIFDMGSNRILTLQGSSTQIVDDSFDDFSNAKISWSPDGQDIIATISGTFSDTTYLLDTDRPNQPPNNISSSIDDLNANWEEIKESREKASINSLPKDVKIIAGENFKILSISPDQDKILYVASRSANLDIIIKPPLKGTNYTPEDRNIIEKDIYVYDVKEDRNYKMDNLNFNNTYSWMNDSMHLIFVRDEGLHVIDYDGLNDNVIYAGPFDKKYVFPWPDSSRIVILTNLGNNTTPQNLYTIILK